MYNKMLKHPLPNLSHDTKMCYRLLMQNLINKDFYPFWCFATKDFSFEEKAIASLQKTYVNYAKHIPLKKKAIASLQKTYVNYAKHIPLKKKAIAILQKTMLTMQNTFLWRKRL